MTFGVITSSSNLGPNVVVSPPDAPLPNSGYQASNVPITNAGATLALDNTLNGATINLNTAAGSIVTLPAAIGSGQKNKFIVTTVTTSNAHVVQVNNASDFMIGQALTIDSATVTGYVAANSGTVSTNSDTITLNATTTGGLKKGDFIEVEDVAYNTWAVRVVTNSSGTAATPFSAAV